MKKDTGWEVFDGADTSNNENDVSNASTLIDAPPAINLYISKKDLEAQIRKAEV